MGARSKLGKRTTRKKNTKQNVTTLVKGEKLQRELQAQGRPQSSGFLQTYTGGRENPKPSFGFVSSSLSSLLPPTPLSPLLWVCCGEEKGRRSYELTPTRAAANSCTAWALITDCPPITFLFCDLESPIYPLYIYLISVLCELSGLLGSPGLKIGLWT